MSGSSAWRPLCRNNSMLVSIFRSNPLELECYSSSRARFSSAPQTATRCARDCDRHGIWIRAKTLLPVSRMNVAVYKRYNSPLCGDSIEAHCRCVECIFMQHVYGRGCITPQFDSVSNAHYQSNKAGVCDIVVGMCHSQRPTGRFQPLFAYSNRRSFRSWMLSKSIHRIK